MLEQPRRPRPSAFTALRFATATALALLVALPAAGRPLAVTTDPGRATWQDRVEVTVSGVVETACGPEVMSLSLVEVTFDSVVLALDEEVCPLPALPTEHPFSVTLDLSPLTPNLYTLVVQDLADSDVTEHELTVHDVSPVELVVPEGVSSDEVAVLEIRGWASCPYAAAELVGDAIEGFYEGECAVLPPPPQVFSLEVPVGPLPAGDYPVHILDFDHFVDWGGGRFVPSLMRGNLRVWDAAGCVPSPTALCLQDGRFRAEVEWTDFQGGSGPGRPIPLPDRDDSGLFWFFDEENVELTVKVLDACVVNDHFWVFVASGSTAGYTITVTDTQSDVTRTYGNDLGEVPSLLPDTAAFATCP